MSTNPMTPLASLGAGFSNEAFGSQAVFRAVLQALSHPGRTVAVEHDAQTPAVGHAASAAVLLALLDSDCTLWLSPRLAASDAGAWLRFHAGCTLVADAAQARFVWVAQGDVVPPLDSLALGTDIYPDQSATCVVDVPRATVTTADISDAWHLRGPGIQNVTAPSTNAAAVFHPSSSRPLNAYSPKMSTATIAEMIAMVVYWRFKNAPAP